MESKIIRPTKSQAIKLVSEQAPQLLEIFRDFQSSNGGWFTWPQKLLDIKKNLKVDNYVQLYEDKRRIGLSLQLAFMGKESYLEFNEELKTLTPEESEKYLVEFTQDLLECDVTEFTESLPDLHPTKEQEELSKADFDALPEAEKAKAIEQAQYFYQFLFASIHDYFSIMVCGEALTSLVPKAINGDDDALCRATKVDRNLITSHPYFISRLQRAQQNGEQKFLENLARPQATPGLIGNISYPGLYIVFAMLESVGWLNDLKHREILDICDKAGLDRWQNRIEDVGYLTKRLEGYRQYQKTKGVSMHSN